MLFWIPIFQERPGFFGRKSSLSVHRGRFSVRNHRTDPWFVLGLAPKLAKLQNALLHLHMLNSFEKCVIWWYQLPPAKQKFQLHLWRYEAVRRIESWQENLANDFWIWIVKPIPRYLQDLRMYLQALAWGLHSLCLCHVRHVLCNQSHTTGQTGSHWTWPGLRATFFAVDELVKLFTLLCFAQTLKQLTNMWNSTCSILFFRKA